MGVTIKYDAKNDIRTEIRKKNGKTEAAKREVDRNGKKVYEWYISPKGKKYKTVEELGAVERRGVDLSPPKSKKKLKTDKKGKFKGQTREDQSLPKMKIKLLPEKINRNNKRP
jgi:hypothetical protein